ncbi:MAG: redoxin domain-containing protein [Acidobacteria bacterium]|nr:redoxin domain-containing protein [Acidobacteriota bacterium]
MKHRMRTLFRAVALFACAAATFSAAGGAQVGARITDFSLPASDGQEHSLSRYAGKIILLEFWSFKCPVTLALNERMAGLQKQYEPKGVVVLAVASNRNESEQEVRRNAANLKLPFPVLLDADGLLADRLGATHTPTIFILDRQGVLRYRGAFGDDRGRSYAEEALDALLAGQPVPRPQTQETGCAIRRSAL